MFHIPRNNLFGDALAYVRFHGRPILSMLRYKRARNDLIVTLEVTGDHNEDRCGVVDARYAKFRTNRARVLAVHRIGSPEELTEALSLRDSTFRYVVGKEVAVDWDGDKNKVCGRGIHYCTAVEVAVGYELPDHYTGLYEKWDEDGRLLWREGYVDGRRHGTTEEYHANGQIRSREHYQNGKCEGLWETWYDNGQISSRENFRDGVLIGVFEIWSEDGQRLENVY